MAEVICSFNSIHRSQDLGEVCKHAVGLSLSILMFASSKMGFPKSSLKLKVHILKLDKLVSLKIMAFLLFLSDDQL